VALYGNSLVLASIGVLALQTRLTIALSGGQVYFIGRAESP